MNHPQLVLLIALGVQHSLAHASELVYRPVNPNFGGPSLNGNFLLGNAQAQNGFEDPDNNNDRNDPAAQFVRALESRLFNGLANQVAEAIFGENAQDSGSVSFDDQTITFERGLEGITLEIIDAGSGSSTVIEVPTLQIN